MLTLEEAIKHCEEVAEYKEAVCRTMENEEGEFTDSGNTYYKYCKRCAKEHRQLAEWLKKLQKYEDLSTYNRENKCYECEYEDSEYYCDDCIWNFVDKFKQRKVNADERE